TWPTADEVATYGGPADLWGESWTAADINAADFGLVVAATNDGSGNAGQARVDCVTITIYTTDAAVVPGSIVAVADMATTAVSVSDVAATAVSVSDVAATAVGVEDGLL